MYVASLIEVGAMPTTEALFAGGGSQKVVEKFNQEWAGSGGVIFGQTGDPRANQFNRFQEAVTLMHQRTTDLICSTADFIRDSNKIRRVVEESHLNAVPECMQMPILMYKPIRDMFEQGRLDGWGIDPVILPSEDFIGRLIKNGTAEETLNEEGELEMPEYLEWEWVSTDPYLDIEEIEFLEESRIFVDNFIQEQLGPEGEMKDPTDYLFSGTISPVQKDEEE